MDIISAGGLLYRQDGFGLKVKLILNKKGSWSLPKGRKEPDECIENCALREVMEEAGCIAEIEDYFGEVSWKLANNLIKTVYLFLMNPLLDGHPNDPDNEIVLAEWKHLTEAIQLVSFPMKQVLIDFLKIKQPEKNNLCLHCFSNPLFAFGWCGDCLKAGQKQLEKKYIKKHK